MPSEPVNLQVAGLRLTLQHSLKRLGYSDNARGMLTPELVRTDLTRTDRTFFLKLGYAWRP